MMIQIQCQKKNAEVILSWNIALYLHYLYVHVCSQLMVGEPSVMIVESFRYRATFTCFYCIYRRVGSVCRRLVLHVLLFLAIKNNYSNIYNTLIYL